VWDEIECALAGTYRKTFAGAQVKGDARPAPIINEQLEGDVRFGVGVGLDLGFLPVTRTGLAIDGSGEILPSHDLTVDVLRFHGADRFEKLDLLVTDGFGIQ